MSMKTLFFKGQTQGTAPTVLMVAYLYILLQCLSHKDFLKFRRYLCFYRKCRKLAEQYLGNVLDWRALPKGHFGARRVW
jgi:hypothetical protein